MLVIAYEFPPIRASNDRTYHFCRYLPRSGWQAVVISPRNPNPWLPPHDNNIEIPADIEVHDAPAMRNFHFLSRIKVLRVWLNSLLFTWNSFNVGKKILTADQKTNDIKCVFGTVPAVSCLFAAYFLSRKFNKPLILDFRDPHYPSGFYKKAFTRALRHAAKIITTTDVYRDVLIEQQALGSKVVVVPNGTDLATIEQIKQERVERSKIFTVIYAGGYFKTYQVGVFVRHLALRLKDQAVKFVVVGKPDEGEESLPDFAREQGLNNVEFRGRLSQKETIRELLKATIAYNGSSHPGGLGGKMYDYLACGLPVLGFNPAASATARFINTHKVGLTTNSEETLLQNLKYFYANPQAVVDFQRTGYEVVKQFDRQCLTERFAEILNASLK